jgi:hypothetical protein
VGEGIAENLASLSGNPTSQELTRRTDAELHETLFEQNWMRDAQREIPYCRTTAGFLIVSGWVSWQMSQVRVSRSTGGILAEVFDKHDVAALPIHL